MLMINVAIVRGRVIIIAAPELTLKQGQGITSTLLALNSTALYALSGAERRRVIV